MNEVCFKNLDKETPQVLQRMRQMADIKFGEKSSMESSRLMTSLQN